MKKGFTLAELLGVISILGILALIITPVVTSSINSSKEKAYVKQVGIIENVAKEWGVENNDQLPEIGSTKKIAVMLSDLISSGKVQDSSFRNPKTNSDMTGCVVVSYNSQYNQYEYIYNDNDTYCEELAGPKKCTLVSDVGTAGISYGDEYSCDPGDGVERTFYVLEDGNNTTLTKGTTGTTGTNEISLIMDSNIGNATAWCKNSSSNSCAADGAKATLASATSNWEVTVNLPTGYQIANVASDADWTAGSDIVLLPTWLYDKLASDDTFPWGYWTSTAHSGDSTFAWRVTWFGRLEHNVVDYYGTIGVRPVITIKNTEIK